MNENILSLAPKSLWKNFRELTLIPHPSNYEEKITKFLLEFGKLHADEAFIDKAGNVVWRKNATPGMENRKGILLQAHCDMVPQKKHDKVHNFIKDPIVTIVKNGYVMADGTTLGGDDGIGVAAIMSIFENETLAHGPLEALITIDEEVGLIGANGLESGILKSDILINLDSEDFGCFFVGCAGGVNIDIHRPLDFHEISKNYIPLKIYAKGFLGGHSGCDIHKNRPNAPKLIFRFLNSIFGKIDFYLGIVEGGNMRNAIPREAWAEIAVLDEDKDYFFDLLAKFQDIIKKEYGKSDPDGKIEALDCPTHKGKKYMTHESFVYANYITNTILSGVFAMNADFQGLVETSNNLSIMRIGYEGITVWCFLRSSQQSQSDYLKQIIQMQMDFCDADIYFDGEYQGWQPNPQSEIVDLAKKIFIEQEGYEPQITATHGGLECGIIIGKYPGMDAISIGPTMSDVHTPTEKIDIASCSKFMTFLETIISKCPIKN